jgi:hypothetical protein
VLSAEPPTGGLAHRIVGVDRMNISLTAWLLGSLVLLLVGVCWLLFKLIAHLRQSRSRYRWFELFICLFVILWGFLILPRVPREVWSSWLTWFAGASILWGTANLGIVLLERFGRPTPLRCSFCNKGQRDVKKLIAGPRVYICDECVDICLTIIKEDKAQEDAGGQPTGPPVPEPTQ